MAKKFQRWTKEEDAIVLGEGISREKAQRLGRSYSSVVNRLHTLRLTPEELLARNDEYQKRSKVWRENNPDYATEKSKEYYAAHPEKYVDYSKKAQAKDPDKYREKGRLRSQERIKLQGQPSIPKKYGDRWSPEDDEYLKKHIELPVRTLANNLKRTVSSIDKRKCILGLARHRNS